MACSGDVRARAVHDAEERGVELGPRTLAGVEEQWQRTSYRGDDDLVFGHPAKGTPLETGKLAKRYLRPALARAGIEKPFRPFHDLPHVADARGSGGQPAHLRAGTSQPLAGLDYRALHARSAGHLPGRRREVREPHVRCTDAKR